MFRNWEEFALGPKDVREEMHVTLDRKGVITIGARAARKFGPYEWAVLLYDKWNGLIGVAPVKAKTENAFPIVNKIKGHHRVIRAGRFCRYYGIKMPQTTACMAQLDEDGTLVLDLKATRAERK